MLYVTLSMLLPFKFTGPEKSKSNIKTMSLILYPVTVKKNVEINNLLLQRIEPINKGRI